LGNATIARRKIPSTSIAHKQLESIEKASNRAADLCKQMLAYSGKGAFVIEPLYLSGLVKDMGEILEASLPKHISFDFALSDNTLPFDADVAQIQQVVLNLIVNASESIDEQEDGVVTVSTGVMQADKHYLESSIEGSSLEAGSYVFLEVSDTGCGMNQRTLRKIFDPFFTTKFTGRGLGMSAILGIVRGHHGCMRIHSEVDRGTIIRVLFPASHEYIEKTTDHDECSAEVELSDMGVALVVDDEEQIREVVGEMLKVCGFTIMTAGNGMEGVEVFQQHYHQIALVLLDITMPKMDGVSCFQQLRKIAPGVKVILVSGYSKKDIMARFGKQKVEGFLQKPFSLVELDNMVKEVLS